MPFKFSVGGGFGGIESLSFTVDAGVPGKQDIPLTTEFAAVKDELNNVVVKVRFEELETHCCAASQGSRHRMAGLV